MTTAAPNQPAAAAAPSTAAAAKAQPVTAPKTRRRPRPRARRRPRRRPDPRLRSRPRRRHPARDGRSGHDRAAGEARRTRVGSPPPTRRAVLPVARLPDRLGVRHAGAAALGIRRMHEGIDIWAPAGTPIQAAGDATVLWAGPRNGYGIAVILDHGNGLGTGMPISRRSRGPRSACRPWHDHRLRGQTGMAAGPHLDSRCASTGWPTTR